MIFGGLLTGDILIVLGLAVKKCPDLLAGYNTLSKEKKKKLTLRS